MPLAFIGDVKSGVKLGLWRLDENVEDFFCVNPTLKQFKNSIECFASLQRRTEFLAVRSLIDCLLGHGIVLRHAPNGKPYLSDGTNIGISHTKGYAAVILSRHSRVAVDIEYLSSRVGRIASKLLRPDEKAETLQDKLLHWCAKETLYKLYPEDRLALADMFVSSISGDGINGIIYIKNVQRNEMLNVFYRVFDGFVLTYAIV